MPHPSSSELREHTIRGVHARKPARLFRRLVSGLIISVILPICIVRRDTILSAWSVATCQWRRCSFFRTKANVSGRADSEKYRRTANFWRCSLFSHSERSVERNGFTMIVYFFFLWSLFYRRKRERIFLKGFEFKEKSEKTSKRFFVLFVLAICVHINEKTAPIPMYEPSFRWKLLRGWYIAFEIFR